MRERDFLKIVIDLDGTILEEKTRAEKVNTSPLPGAVDAINKLYEMGHKIIIYSARAEDDLELTSKQLNKYGIKYNRLVLGKPVGDIFIDDRAFVFRDWRRNWPDLLQLINEKMGQLFEEKNNWRK
jgi:uncharacterized HAD superfamily protein